MKITMKIAIKMDGQLFIVILIVIFIGRPGIR